MVVRFPLSLHATLLALMSSGCVQAEPKLEEWRTPITCGGKQFEVISRCYASPDPMELNVCESRQRLMSGAHSTQIPTRTATKDKPILFATFWNCFETRQGPVIRLGYTSGQGRSPDDEDVEFFDYKLSVIKDKTTQRKLYELMPTTKGGYVKSIMPSEGN